MGAIASVPKRRPLRSQNALLTNPKSIPDPERQRHPQRYVDKQRNLDAFADDKPLSVTHPVPVADSYADSDAVAVVFSLAFAYPDADAVSVAERLADALGSSDGIAFHHADADGLSRHSRHRGSRQHRDGWQR